MWTIHLLLPLMGGLLIGVASALLLVSLGRIAGISGILAGAFFAPQHEKYWRGLFLMGLFMSPWVWKWCFGVLPDTEVDAGPARLIVAGLLVGFGTRLGSGCTSGHGICGLSRFSRRSMVAALTFMATAMLVTAIVRGRLG